MGNRVVDVKEDEPNDVSTARLTRYWTDKSLETMARIKISIGELQFLIS